MYNIYYSDYLARMNLLAIISIGTFPDWVIT